MKPDKPKKLNKPEKPEKLASVFRKDYADQYDLLYNDKNYEAECDMIEEVFRRYGNSPIKTILDLGCGTGNHAIPLAKRGYQVTGVDISQDMLSIARSKADNLFEGVSTKRAKETKETRQTKETKETRETGIIKPAFSEGDLRSLNLNNTFDAVLMMFAVLGYQTTNDDVLAALRTVRRHLKPGGLFVFDVWYGPAVVKIRPNTRTKTIRTDSGEIVRTASARLDVGNHICEVNYQLKLYGGQVIDEGNESHRVRYFFPLEIEQWIVQANMNLLRLSSFPEIQKEADESSWNVLGLARAFV